jgi:hypothetical protein
MEKRYEDIIHTIEARHQRQIADIMSRVNDDPNLKCLECGESIFLSPYTYWNVKDTDVRCKNCKALLTISLENGELKKCRVRDPATSQD